MRSGGKTLVNATSYDIKQGKTIIGGTAYTISFRPTPTIITSGATSQYSYNVSGNYSGAGFASDTTYNCYRLYTGSGSRHPSAFCCTTTMVDLTQYTSIHIRVARVGNLYSNNTVGQVAINATNANMNGAVYIGSDFSLKDLPNYSSGSWTDLYYDITSYTGSYYMILRVIDDTNDGGQASFAECYWALE